MGVAGGIAAASIASAGIGAVASSSAAGKQSSANQQASQNALQEFQFNAAQEAPFVNAGTQAAQYLQNSIGTYGNYFSPYYAQAAGQNNALQQALPGAFTQANLESTPGYQFTLGQGLKATQNSAAARGLGISGAALKGAANYATGLADNTYTNRFNEQQQIFNDKNAQVQNLFNLGTSDLNSINQSYNRVANLATLGQNAAAQTGTQGTAAANNSGNFLANAGAAQAAGTIGVGNALAGGIGGAANAYLQQNALNQFLQAGQPNASGVYGGGPNGPYAGIIHDQSGYLTG